MIDNNFSNILENIDDDLKEIIYLEKSTNSLIIKSFCNANRALKIIYSDKIKSYILSTNKATTTLKKIDYTISFKDEYISETFEYYEYYDAIKGVLKFSNNFDFVLCDKNFRLYTEGAYSDFIKTSYLDYTNIRFSKDKYWHKKIFSPFHYRKIKQIKNVLDAYIASSPCLKKKKSINYVKL